MRAYSVIGIFDNKREYMLATWKCKLSHPEHISLKHEFVLYIFPALCYQCLFSVFMQTIIDKSSEISQKQITIKTMKK